MDSTTSSGADGGLRRSCRVSGANRMDNLHDSLSKMHNAIQNKDFECVQRLLDAGDKFCKGEGPNCFMLGVHAPSSTPDSRWKFLMKMLRVDPKGVHARCYDGSTLLMYCCNNVDKVKYLVSLGADINAVDKAGHSVIKRLFCQSLNIDKWNQRSLENELLKAAIELLVKKDLVVESSFVESLCSYITSSDPRCNRARFFICFIYNAGYVNTELVTRILHKHPMFFLIEQNCLSRTFNMSVEVLNHFLRTKHEEINSILLLEKAVLFTTSSTVSGRPSWKKTKKLLNIPDQVTFDVISYFLFTLNLSWVSTQTESWLRLLLGRGFVPSSNPGVVHPIHALLYNINQSDWHASSSVSKLLLDCFVHFKDYPLTHQLVRNPEGHLEIDLLLLMRPLMMTYHSIPDDRKALFECVIAAMQLSPMHPFYNLGILRHDCVHFGFMSRLTTKLLEKCLCCTFQGADESSVAVIQQFHNSLRQSAVLTPEMSKLKTILGDYAGKVSTLKDLSVFEVRKTLFVRRASSSISIPSLVRTLIEKGYLPKTLKNDMLIFKVDGGDFNF